MALVILPCDLPNWHNLQKQLSLMSSVTNAKHFTEGMFKIHTLCNITTGLDPDEQEKPDPDMFLQLESFLTNLPSEEQNYFYKKILPIMIRRALDLKVLKPGGGFYFSLQQQADEKVYRRSFLASLLAHSFFSTFPKRTWKTHPTLQDFNFTFFFKFLDQTWQQAKLKSIFHYFELLENVIDENECVTYSRQVMSGKQWLTIDDWVESCLPLCPIVVRNEGVLGEVEPQCLRVCFSSSKIGGSVLCEGTSQESIEFCTVPELICILASVEALEDNEVFLVKDAYQVARISEPRQKAILEKYEKPIRVVLCCMDAENYTRLPISQLEEDNLLRELNKALLGFGQGKSPGQKSKGNLRAPVIRRLSPIGESFSPTPSDPNLSKDGSPPSVLPTKKLDSPSRRKCWLKTSCMANKDVEGRRGRFIVLGSSGDCLPVNRNQTFLAGKRNDIFNSEISERTASNKDSLLSSAQSEDEEDDVFHSARSSFNNDNEGLKKGKKRKKLKRNLITNQRWFQSKSKCSPFRVPKTGKLSDTFGRDSQKREENLKSNVAEANSFIFDDERRYSFAEKLREALLRGARAFSTSSDDISSSYAVDISFHGSVDEDNNVRCKRGTSTGFMLQESLDDGFYQDSVEQEMNFKGNQSDKYSFTTDGSDLDDLYDQLSKWMNTANNDSANETTQGQAMSELASNLLKRAFSDSYAGRNEKLQNKKISALPVRSISLEQVRRNPKIAAQLMCLLSKNESTLKSMLPNKDGQRPVATGNWGCGSCYGGDPQIKLTIQWLAASYTGLPNLIYYTCRNHKLVKLDTVRRVLIDRGWTVGQLTTSLLQYAHTSLHDSRSSATLFDLLITSVHS